MGAFISYLSGLLRIVSLVFPPKPQFNVDLIPDLAGKVIIVTGRSCDLTRALYATSVQLLHGRRWRLQVVMLESGKKQSG